MTIKIVVIIDHQNKERCKLCIVVTAYGMIPHVIYAATANAGTLKKHCYFILKVLNHASRTLPRLPYTNLKKSRIEKKLVPEHA